MGYESVDKEASGTEITSDEQHASLAANQDPESTMWVDTLDPL